MKRTIPIAPSQSRPSKTNPTIDNTAQTTSNMTTTVHMPSGYASARLNGGKTSNSQSDRTSLVLGTCAPRLGSRQLRGGLAYGVLMDRIADCARWYASFVRSGATGPTGITRKYLAAADSRTR